MLKPAPLPALPPSNEASSAVVGSEVEAAAAAESLGEVVAAGSWPANIRRMAWRVGSGCAVELAEGSALKSAFEPAACCCRCCAGDGDDDDDGIVCCVLGPLADAGTDTSGSNMLDDSLLHSPSMLLVVESFFSAESKSFSSACIQHFSQYDIFENFRETTAIL